MMCFSIIVLLSAAVLSIDCLTLHCEYKTGWFSDIDEGESITCVAMNLIVTSPLEEVDSVSPHYSNNDDVRGLLIDQQTVNNFPSGIDRIFKSLRGIQISNSNLMRINKADLQQFPELRGFHAGGNKLKVLEKDLFVNNPKLEYIYFDDNQLRFIEADLLVNLHQLRYADFSNNPCMKEETKTKVQKLKKKFQKRSQNSENARKYDVNLQELNRMLEVSKDTTTKLKFWQLETSTQAQSELITKLQKKDEDHDKTINDNKNQLEASIAALRSELASHKTKATSDLNAQRDELLLEIQQSEIKHANKLDALKKENDDKLAAESKKLQEIMITELEKKLIELKQEKNKQVNLLTTSIIRLNSELNSQRKKVIELQTKFNNQNEKLSGEIKESELNHNRTIIELNKQITALFANFLECNEKETSVVGSKPKVKRDIKFDLICSVKGSTGIAIDVFISHPKTAIRNVKDKNGKIMKGKLATEITFKEQETFYLPLNFAEVFTKLQKLSVIQSRLMTIANVKIRDMKFLKSVDLSNNQLRVVTASDFAGLNQLENLDLSNNRIVEVAQEAFKGLNKLMKLNLNANGLTEFNTKLLSDMPKLNILQLRSNKLKSIKTTSLDLLDRLTTIDLAENVCVNAAFPKTTRIQLKKEIAERCLPLPELCCAIERTADDVICKATYFAVHLPNLRLERVKSLASCDNDDSTNEEVADVTSLEIINQHVEFLPINLKSLLPNIRKLLVRNSKLKALGNHELEELKNLIEISIIENPNLTSLPADTFIENLELRKLDISMNGLKDLPNGLLKKMDNLKHLNASFNQIAKASRDFLHLVRFFEVADFRGNKCIDEVADDDFELDILEDNLRTSCRN